MILAVDVGLVVGKEQVGIAIEQLVEKRPEEAAITMRELAGTDSVDDFAQEGVGFVDGSGVVAFGNSGLDLIGGEAEEEEVLVADGVADFYVGTVEGSDGANIEIRDAVGH